MRALIVTKHKIKIVVVNRYYFGLAPLFKSKILLWRTKITLYKVLARPIALYACIAWATTMANVNKLATFERKFLEESMNTKINYKNKSRNRKTVREANIFGDPESLKVVDYARLLISGDQKIPLGWLQDGSQTQNSQEDISNNCGMIGLVNI